MKKTILFFSIILFSATLHAGRTDCPAAKVHHIQIEGTKILYQQSGGPWRTLGYLTNNDGTRERYSALLAAQVAGKPIRVGYPVDGYDCSVTNYGASAFLVRTYN